MKHITIVFLALFLMGWGAESQAQGKCFEKGNVLLNVGVNYGARYYSSYGSLGYIGSGFFLPNIFFSADFGVHDYVSVGPYTSVGFDKYGDIKFRYIAVGARGNFHWWQLLDDKVDADLLQEQLELYVTVYLGGYITSSNNDFYGTKGQFDGGGTFGFRYYPKANNTFGIFTEWGRTPLGWGLVGATFKLGNK
ncbi:MAG: hypothetical protein GY751_22400 [Bacteroidetes bacterium]|nr:hypothetical protein [Bacteroidota bacterium]